MNNQIATHLYEFLGGGLLCVISLYIGTNRVKQNYKFIKLILDEEGVEFKAPMSLYKKIYWNNLMVEEDSNGTINLYDKSLSLFQRKFNGKGWIIVQPEIMNRDNLKIALISRSSNYRDL